MIVSDFIEWLKTQDQGATIEVWEKTRGRGYDGNDYVSRQEFEVEKHSEYCDLRDNSSIPVNASYYQGRYLFLGGEG